MQLLPRGRVAQWTREKIDTLSTQELRQLRANAERLNEEELAALCTEVLGVRPRGEATVRRAMPKGVRRLVARGKAFEQRGVVLKSRTWSRSGIRESDGAVVILVPAAEVAETDGMNRYLLWAPNAGGSHPWSDKPGGQERLAHCKLALERGQAEGMLVYAKGPEDAVPGSKAAGADGVDAERILNLKVEKIGEEYWATWPEIRRTTVRTMK